MGVKKSKSKKSSLGNVAKKAKGVYNQIAGNSGGSSKKKKDGSTKRHRQTPEKLAKKLLIIKLQKKIYKAKYGGR